MENYIKITKNLKFDFADLMRSVDSECEFTLRDVLNSCNKSKIPMDVLKQILRCSHIDQYVKEMKSKKFNKDGEIEYLEIGWHGEINAFWGEESSGSSWHFRGMGKKGVIPKDLNECCTKKEINKMKKEKWQQSYAIELTPIHELANYPIKICKEICITDWRDYKKHKGTEDLYTKLDFQPNITLMELLYWILWELSWFGSIAKRDGVKADLDERVKELDKAREEGRLDEVTIPWEDVKKSLKKKIKEINKSKKSKKEKENGMQRMRKKKE